MGELDAGDLVCGVCADSICVLSRVSGCFWILCAVAFFFLGGGMAVVRGYGMSADGVP